MVIRHEVADIAVDLHEEGGARARECFAGLDLVEGGCAFEVFEAAWVDNWPFEARGATGAAGSAGSAGITSGALATTFG